MASLVFLILVAQKALVYSDPSFGIQLYTRPLNNPDGWWKIAEEKDDETGMVFVTFESGSFLGSGILKAKLVYGIIPGLGNLPDPPRHLLDNYIAQFKGKDVQFDEVVRKNVAGLTSCQINMWGNIDGAEGIVRFIFLNWRDKAIIIVFGKDNVASFNTDDIKKMDDFTGGLEIRFDYDDY